MARKAATNSATAIVQVTAPRAKGSRKASAGTAPSEAAVESPAIESPAVKRAATKSPVDKSPVDKPKRVSRKTTPSPETLAELGLARLTGLVLAETARNPTFKKLVTAAVASLQGPGAVAALIDRRLTTLERSGGYIDWQKQRTFAADLDAMLTTVVNELAALDAEAALDRLIRFLGGAADVLGRADDSSGRIHGVYERAADAAAALIVDLNGPEAAAMALRLVARLETDGYGLVERLLHDLIPDLPEGALAPLDAALTEEMPTPDEDPADPYDSYDLPDGRDWLLEAERSRLLRMRQALAVRTGDVDAYIALELERMAGFPDTVAIAQRLLEAGRAREALEWIRRPLLRSEHILTREELLFGALGDTRPDFDRTILEIRILDALGEGQAAQDLRWRAFEETLDRDLLRAYLAKLPDFEDDDALDRAFAVAEAHGNPYAALGFFTHWPDHARAARVVTAHRGAWDGRNYTFLVPAAEALEHSEPLAATELYRLLIDDILKHGRSAAYPYAARYLSALDALAGRIEPDRVSPDPEAYREGLRRQHGRKAGFWVQTRR